jgi:hypothetical protein
MPGWHYIKEMRELDTFLLIPKKKYVVMMTNKKRRNKERKASEGIKDLY